MVEVTIDGQKVEVAEGSMVMHAAEKLGQYVPHFCYHKKLSIAANCRMCLVEVEKAPKPMPACATPVSQGMVVHTKSEKAVKAQQGVMEFLLINHPLDCPICDQGGECQLQDLAVGYGGGASRYTEEKRVVFHKSLGPLVSAEEMTRCIHCTRCVRFGQEIAGAMELGMLNRGEHSEITSFLGRTVDSELSGNMIDICPVGALTSKPFRYSARTWELTRRRSVSPHDALGTNVILQVKGGKVMRVVPHENEAINECWISDRDRFSYEGLNSEDRLTVPMVKHNGSWVQTDWPTAIAAAADGLQKAKQAKGVAAVRALFSANSTVEEIFLLNKLVRGLGSSAIDFRLRTHDFNVDASRKGVPWLGMPIADVSLLDRVLVVGSFLRKDQPLLSARIRQAVKRGAKVSIVHSSDDDLLMPLVGKSIVRPSLLPKALAQVAAAIAREKNIDTPKEFAGLAQTESATLIAKSLCSGQNQAIFLGSYAIYHPQASELVATAQWIAGAIGARLGALPDQANTVGAYLLQALNNSKAHPVSAAATVLLNLEPLLDASEGQKLAQELQASNCVVALSAYKSAVEHVATVMLPIAPFSETAGSYVNMAGDLQSFKAATLPLGDARPAWKVLRVLAEQVGVAGLDFSSAEEVLKAAVPQPAQIQAYLSNEVSIALTTPSNGVDRLERVADIPIYDSDAIVRRASSLQLTRDARTPAAVVHPHTATDLGLSGATRVDVSNDTGQVRLALEVSDRIPEQTLRVAGGRHETAVLGSLFSTLKVERA
jgi:NADH-quinone oxidoreductase subunit G